MAKLSPDIERMVDGMDLPKGLPSDARQAIREAIESSHYLQRRMANEIGEGNLAGLTIGDRPGELGHFNDPDKTVSINPEVFKLYGSDPKLLRDALTYVIGHEVGHSATTVGRKAALDQVRNDTHAAYWTENEQGFVDMTGITRRYVAFAGTDETRADIEGWNAYASRVEGEGPVDRQALLKRATAFSNLPGRSGKSYELLDGAEEGIYLRYMSEDGKVHTDAAREVAERGLTPDRMAYYSTYPLEVAAGISQQQSKPYETRVNLEALGQTKESLERAGLDFDGKSFPITDTSQGLNWTKLNHTRDKGEGEKLTIEPESQLRPPVLADNPSHPDFETFNRIHFWVRGTGQWDEEKSRNIASSLYREQTADPLIQRVDKVTGALGRDGTENVFAVYAPHGDKPPFFHAHVDGREAAQQPAQQNLEQAEQLKLQQVQQQQRDQVQRGPAMSM